ncbi:hypothetical protein BKA62DRAFT_482740 [Auriculariales sp. MPI-PUGE-AT-0066]|nr:hypothetical protein BKA62DRAFT_482740 [Auriculariales sp. MPI-PUGE-AT-0066]
MRCFLVCSCAVIVAARLMPPLTGSELGMRDEPHAHPFAALDFAIGPNEDSSGFHFSSDNLNMPAPGHSHTSSGHGPINLASVPEPNPLFNPAHYAALGGQDDVVDANQEESTGPLAVSNSEPSVTLTFADGDDDQPTDPAGLAVAGQSTSFILPAPSSTSSALLPDTDEQLRGGVQQALAGTAPVSTSVISSSTTALVSQTRSTTFTYSASELSTVTDPIMATPTVLAVSLSASRTTPSATTPFISITPSANRVTDAHLSGSSQAQYSTSTDATPTGTPSTHVAAANPVDQARVRTILIIIGVLVGVGLVFLLFRKWILNKVCGHPKVRSEDEEFWVARPIEHSDYTPKSAEIGLDVAIEKHRESLQLDSPVINTAPAHTPGPVASPKLQPASPGLPRPPRFSSEQQQSLDDRHTPRTLYPRSNLGFNTTTVGAFMGTSVGAYPEVGVPGCSDPSYPRPVNFGGDGDRLSIHPGDIWPGSRPY